MKIKIDKPKIYDWYFVGIPTFGIYRNSNYQDRTEYEILLTWLFWGMHIDLTFKKLTNGKDK